MHDKKELVTEVRSVLKKMNQVFIIGQCLGESGMLRAWETFKLFMSCSMSKIHFYKF